MKEIISHELLREVQKKLIHLGKHLDEYDNKEISATQREDIIETLLEWISLAGVLIYVADKIEKCCSIDVKPLGEQIIFFSERLGELHLQDLSAEVEE